MVLKSRSAAAWDDVGVIGRTRGPIIKECKKIFEGDRQVYYLDYDDGSWCVCVYVKLIKLHILNMYNLLNVNHATVKLFLN